MPAAEFLRKFGVDRRSDAEILAEADRRGKGDIYSTEKAARKRAVISQRSGEQNRLQGLADKPFDLSFMDLPGFQEAQNRTTIDPIRKAYGTATRRGIQASLRTGGPVGAQINTLAGQEGEAIQQQGAENFLRNVNTGIDIAGRRFSQNLGASQFGEGRYQFEREMEDRKNARKKSFLGTLGDIAGTGLALAFPPKTAAPGAAGTVSGGGNAAAGTEANRRRFSLRRTTY